MVDNATPMELGSNRQLLFDPLFLAESSGVELRMNAPYQDPEPVLTPDKPWELARGGVERYYGKFERYHTVMLEDGRFRMWYAVSTEGDGRKRMLLCYAESSDGVHWEKPTLGIIPFNGSSENNIVGPPSPNATQQGATVFRDDHGPAGERYKLWTKYVASDEDREKGIVTGLWAMVSPDGLRWKLLQEEGYPINRGNAADAQHTCFWDEDIGKYVGFVRMKNFPKGTKREPRYVRGIQVMKCDGLVQRKCWVGHLTSDDFRNWTMAEKVFEADERDEASPVPGGAPEWRPIVDYYVPGGMKVPGVANAYIMLPNAYYHWRDDSFPCTLDVRLATSRNMADWYQHPEREPFLRLGLEGSASDGMILANPWLIPVGDEIWLYYAGIGSFHRPHHRRKPPVSSGIFRARLRRDGFVSADASYDGGEFTTPVVTFEGSRLDLNLDGSAGGWLQVEILTPEGKPVKGYELAACDALRCNSTGKTVTWGGEQDVSALAGKPVRLRFVMRSMKLFAFQFLHVEKAGDKK